MNYLAHLWLAGPDPDSRAGGFLGDFLRGSLDGEAGAALPERVALGVRLHRRIDAFTDAHPATREALESLGPDHRRWGGIGLDVYWDHLLARDFEALSDGDDLVAFSRSALEDVRRHRDLLPPRGRRVLDGLRTARVLPRYREGATVDGALARIGERVRRTNPLAELGPALRARESELRPLFATLITELRHEAEGWRAANGLP